MTKFLRATFLRSACAALPILLATAAACGAGDPPSRNGVDDVKVACEVRLRWTARAAEKCAQCAALAPLEDCGCESLKDFSAKCVAQGRARRAERSCTREVDLCVSDCMQDCACMDACYANVPACRAASSAQDGCVVEVCAPYCNAEASAP